MRLEQTVGVGRLTEPLQENYQPAREPSRHSDVVVPLLQAVISAALLTGFVGALIWASKSGAGPVWLLAVFMALLSAFWFWSLGWVKGTLYRIESLIRHDLTGDNQIGEPELRPVPVHGQEIPRGVDANAAERQRRLREFVAVSFAKGTSVRALREAGFTEPESEQLGGYLRDLGVAAWVSDTYHKAGWRYLRSQTEIEKIIAHTVWLPKQPEVKR